MTVYAVGQRIQYRQVKHEIPMNEVKGSMPVHEDAKQGIGTIHAVVRVGDEKRLIVLPDSEANKPKKTTILLRLPPDEVEVL
jgi:hypothetical protein